MENTTPNPEAESGITISAITIQDLAALRAVVEIAATRGAFHANEMANIGNLYNKLDGFLRQLEQPAVSTPDNNIPPVEEQTGE